MSSHHFLGTGRLAPDFERRVAAPDRLVEEVTSLVEAAGLAVVATRAVPFPGGGSTFVWVLAESHLVLHHWPEEGYATIDLHVCDYKESNAAKARRLRNALETYCFTAGSARWSELELEPPARTAAAS